MTTPMETETDDSRPVDERALDRLVDGSLSAGERRWLLMRLELEPDGWRRCALAFLEAQAWSEAMRPLAAPGAWSQSEVAMKPPARPAAPRVPLRRRLPATAALVASFLAGWAAHRGSPPQTTPPGAPVRQAPAVAANPIPPVPVPPAPPASRPAPLPDPVIQRLEHQGYQVERHKRLVSMETPNGQRLALPVDELRVRFVGDRTY